jgi:dTDP-4-amino-4,6-dideoxygalactose transaminase
MIPIAKPFLGKEEAQAAHDTILTGWITQGPKVAEFEKNFAEFVGSKYAVAVSNCTTALHLSMIVAGIGPGDEVICPSMSYIATANSIVYVGATPVFSEINRKDYNLDIKDVEKRITSKTKAILLVHQMGMPGDIDGFKQLCDKYNLTLIEDAACAIGSEYKRAKIGSHSDYVCFSFHPRKVISTGDGGMISTSNEEVYNKLKLYRQHGMSINDRVRHESKTVLFEDHLVVGFNYRLTDIQAAVGIEQLKRLPWIIEERQKLAKMYHELLSGIDWMELPKEQEGCFSNYQTYSVYLKPDAPINRDDLMQLFLENGISTRRGIMTSHRETAYKNRGTWSLPISEDAADNSICLPLWVGMKEENVINIVTTLKVTLR